MSGACSCQFLVRFSFAQLVTFRHLGYSAGNFEAPKGLTAIYSVACVSSYATCTQHARNIACCAAAQRCNLRCFAPSPTQFRNSQPSKQSSTILDPASTKYCKIQRCVVTQQRVCCVGVAHDRTHATSSGVQNLRFPCNNLSRLRRSTGEQDSSPDLVAETGFALVQVAEINA